MLKKTDVYDFIDRVKRKAIKAVDEKNKIELEKAIDSELNKKENHALKEAIEAFEHHNKMGVIAQEIIKKNVPRCNTYLYDRDMRTELFGYLGYSFPNGFDNIRTVHAENNLKISKIREEYAKIMRIVKNKKNWRTRQNGTHCTRI